MPKPAQERAIDEALDRYWDAIVAGGEDAPPTGLEAELAATVRHLHGIDRPPAPRPTLAATVWKDLMRAIEPATAVSPVADSRNTQGAPVLPPLVNAPPGQTPWVTPFATAALILLTLLASIMALRGPLPHTQERRLSTIPALETTPAVSPRPSMIADEVLMQGTFVVIPAVANWAGIQRDTLAPGAELVLGKNRNYGEGPIIYRVESGALTITADGPISITRAGDDQPTAVPPGTDVVLQVDDHGFAPSGVTSRWRNDGDVPTVVIDASIATFGYGSAPAGVTSHSLINRGLIPPLQVPAKVTVRRVTLPASSVLPIDALPGLTLAYVESGDVDVVDPHAMATPANLPNTRSPTPPVMTGGYGLHAFPAGRVFQSSGSEPATMLLMTINPAGPSEEGTPRG